MQRTLQTQQRRWLAATSCIQLSARTTRPVAAQQRSQDLNLRPVGFDRIIEVSSLAQYHVFELELRKLGFKNDIREDAPICRYVHGTLTLDVMPTEAALGFSNPDGADFSSRGLLLKQLRRRGEQGLLVTWTIAPPHQREGRTSLRP